MHRLVKVTFFLKKALDWGKLHAKMCAFRKMCPKMLMDFHEHFKIVVVVATAAAAVIQIDVEMYRSELNTGGK